MSTVRQGTFQDLDPDETVSNVTARGRPRFTPRTGAVAPRPEDDTRRLDVSMTGRGDTMGVDARGMTRDGRRFYGNGTITRSRDGGADIEVDAAYQAPGKPVRGAHISAHVPNKSEAESAARELVQQFAEHDNAASARALAIALARNVVIRQHDPKKLAKDAELLREACGQSRGASTTYELVTDENGRASYVPAKQTATDVATLLGIAVDSHDLHFEELPKKVRNQLVPGSYTAASRSLKPPSGYTSGLVSVVPRTIVPDHGFTAAAEALEQPEYYMVVGNDTSPIAGYPIDTAKVVSKTTAGAVEVELTPAKGGKPVTKYVVFCGKKPNLRREAMTAVIEAVVRLDQAGKLSTNMDNVAAAASHTRQQMDRQRLYDEDDEETYQASHATWANNYVNRRQG